MNKSNAAKWLAKKSSPLAAKTVANGETSLIDQPQHITFLPHNKKQKPKVRVRNRTTSNSTIKLDRLIKEEDQDEFTSVSDDSVAKDNINGSNIIKVHLNKSGNKVIKANNENAQANSKKTANKKRKFADMATEEVKSEPKKMLASKSKVIKRKKPPKLQADVIVEPNESSINLSLLNCDLTSFDLIQEQNLHLQYAIQQSELQLKTLQNEELSLVQRLSALQNDVFRARDDKSLIQSKFEHTSGAFVKICKALAPLNEQPLPENAEQLELINTYLDRIEQIAQQRDKSEENFSLFNLLKDNLKCIWLQMQL